MLHTITTMASVAEARRSPFSGDHNPNMHRSIPILPSSSSSSSLAPPRDPMDITPSPSSTSAMGPPSLGAPSADRQHLAPAHPSPLANGDADINSSSNGSNNGAPNGNGSASASSASGPAVGAAAAAQQPKVVQTAFIHKLYKCVSVSPRSDQIRSDAIRAIVNAQVLTVGQHA